MEISTSKIEELASVLYAYESVDSDLHLLSEPEDIDYYEETLDSLKLEYNFIADIRKEGLREAVCWLSTQEINDLRSLIPDFYRRIWDKLGEDEYTEDIIESGQLDEARYLAGIEAILSRLSRI